MTNLSAYIGRSVDYLALTDSLTVDTLLDQKLIYPGNSGFLITGIRKLFQRFIMELLTEQGSQLYQPERGTLFFTKIRYGSIRTTQDLAAAFVEAELTARINLQLEESLTDPADERYDEARLVASTVALDQVNMTIEVTSLAGTNFTAIAPISTRV